MIDGGRNLFNRYYQQELYHLRELSKEFAQVHPAAAPLLSGQSADPDVERLLEGVSFLTGLLRQKLDDELPEIVRGLSDVVFPHYLRPVPASSIVAFSPKTSLREPLTVPAGTSLKSVEVDGFACIFRTCAELEVHPLRLRKAETRRRAGSADEIVLSLSLQGLELSRWQPNRLAFYLGGGYGRASDLLLLLTRYLRRIRLSSPGGQTVELAPGALVNSGLKPDNHLLPFPAQSFSGYRRLQEYFVLPQKFLFLELTGWEQWQQRGAGNDFEIIFDFKPAPLALPDVGADDFQLFATPVINLFRHEADPITLDHRREKVRVRPSGAGPENLQVYSVDEVTGYQQGSVAEKSYLPINLFARDQGEGNCYQQIHAVSPVHDRPEVFLGFTYPPQGGEPTTETLVTKLTCTNGNLPERLQLGDICRQTSDSPELLDFANITPPTAAIDPPLGGDDLWRLLSHLSLNLLSLCDLDGLKEMLRLYLFPRNRDRVKVTANLKRVEGLSAITASPADRLVRGLPMRGREINLTARQDHFAGLGDLLLFGSVLDLFFSEYAAMNSFTRLTIRETITGESYSWPERLGDRPLL